MDYYFILNNIFKLETLSSIFSDMVEAGEKFIIYFPGGPEEIIDDPRERGKEEFLALEGIEVGASEYLPGGTKLVGDMNTKSKNLFYHYFSLAKLKGFEQGLNHFNFYRRGKMIFEIQNFRIGYILRSFYDGKEREQLQLDLYEPFVL